MRASMFEQFKSQIGVGFLKLVERFTIQDPRIFFGLASAVVAYLLYTMIRKRRGKRPGFADREPEL
jgi:hypothetical protein